MPKIKLRQKGSILIIALLVIGLVEVIALGFVESHRIARYFSRNFFDVNEAMNFALGGEDWAKGKLIDIYSQKEVNEAYYYLPRTQVKGGYIEGFISDVQGKYNLNNMKSIHYRTGFARMLHFLGLNDNMILQNLLSSSLTYVNANSSSVPDLQPSLFCTVTELRGLPGITPKVFDLLLPNIFVIPEITPLNINSADIPSLMILSSDMTEKIANEIIKMRAINNFKTPSEFLTLPIITELKSPIENVMVTVKSNYFISNITVHYHDIDLTLISLLKVFKDSESNQYKTLVQWRSFGTL